MDLNFDINAYLRLNFMDMALVCISTLLIVLIAKRFFWDKACAYLDARTAAIQADIDAGKDCRSEGEQYKEQYVTQLANAKGEAHSLIEQAKANALQEKRDILAQTRAEVETMKLKAQKDVEREKVQAREEMKDAIVDVAFDAAKVIVGKELDETTHKAFVDDFIKRAGEETWQA